LDDLRGTPAVLIGGNNNAWTTRLDDDLRFRFEFDREKRIGYLRDSQDTGNPRWAVVGSMPYSEMKRDYAVITRVVDPRTERVVVMVAGVGKDGTHAAGEFVTEERHMAALARQAGRGWEKKNLQAVIETEVINGNTGPPRILVVHVW
jgi:hypothetical protein